MKKKIWVDFTNTPHVHFLIPIMLYFKESFTYYVTARDFSETVSLLKYYGIDAKVIGKHKGKKRINKIKGVINRNIKLLRTLPSFDIGMAVGGINASQVCGFLNKPLLSFADNETSDGFFTFPSYLFCPSSIPKKKLVKSGYKSTKIFQYNGLKEDIYIANFVPNKDFVTKCLPFDNYVLVRPENLKADYVESGTKTIIPEILSYLSDNNINVVYLPRYASENSYSRNLKNVFIPPKVLNGLDLCYYSKGVITGAGTLAREAAILGIPSVTVFPGKELLDVDRKLIEMGKMEHTRNPKKACSLINNLARNSPSRKSSQIVFKELMGLIDKRFQEIL